jgi:hypothetical protein
MQAACKAVAFYSHNSMSANQSLSLTSTTPSMLPVLPVRPLLWM